MAPRRPENAEAMRAAALAERDYNLQNAWRNPTGQGDPTAATGAEAQRRRWTHEDHR
jgi:hypothetical protein